EARLAEPRQAVAFLDPRWLGGEVKGTQRVRRREHRERLAPIVIDDLGLAQAVGGTAELVERADELPPIGEAIRREVRRQGESRDARLAGLGVVDETEGVVVPTETAAAFADDRL